MSSRNAYEWLQSDDVDTERPIVRFNYECPDCGARDTLFGEPVGARCRVFCEACEVETSDDDGPVWGIHDILEQYVLDDPDDLHLKRVPVSRVTVLSDAEADRLSGLFS